MIRFFDFILSFLGLTILSPIFFMLLIIGLFENGSPLFKQYRVGRNQKPFILIKFRTMRKETKSVATHLINPLMITPFGKFLRYTKLDEIPQLYNVLIGNMSLVGPRPCLSNQKKLITERKKNGVFKVRPGITGLAQVKGLRGETKSSLAMEHRVRLDTLYIENWSLILDVKIIVLTIINVFKGDEKAY